MLSNPTLEHISDILLHTSVVSLSSGLLTPEEWQAQQDAQAPTPSDLKSPPPTSKEEDATDDKVMSPVPKPEVNLEDMDAKVMSPVPNTGDRDAKVMSPVPKPEVNPGEALSKEAIDKRLRRIFQPRSDGSYLVSDEFVKNICQEVKTVKNCWSCLRNATTSRTDVVDVHAVQGGMVLNPEVVVEFGSPPLRKGFGSLPP